ncbi:MAG: hypothetical protein DCF17_15705 [Shackletoniella antarctica]|uniref:Uncharacterized protein n=1 Tax=Shackletoniella antarctica TaxID=268115 RepID=A0A2W4W036_9CYAN|nr:MAG: hypothetical protein DCF17_15705 [Shackletoniella antarctica]
MAWLKLHAKNMQARNMQDGKTCPFYCYLSSVNTLIRIARYFGVLIGRYFGFYPFASIRMTSPLTYAASFWLSGVTFNVGNNSLAFILLLRHKITLTSTVASL